MWSQCVLIYCSSSVAGHSADTVMVNGDGHTEEAESKQDGSTETDGEEESNEQEVIVIQDTGFTVKIQAPGTEPFDLQVRIISSQAAAHYVVFKHTIVQVKNLFIVKTKRNGYLDSL